MENKFNSYEYLELLEPRRSNSLPTKCRSMGNVSKSSSTTSKETQTAISKPSKQKQDDVQKIVHKIRNVFSVLTSPKDNQSHPSSVIETDYEKDNRFESPLTSCNVYGTFEDTHEYKTCHILARQLKKCLVSAKDKQLLCDLILPANLLSRIAQDVLRMSHCEPCGVRGGVVFVTLDDGSANTISIGKVVCDSSIVPTFELYLTLKEDTRSWVTMRKWLFYIQTCFREDKNIKKNSPKVLYDGFQLVKRKLYRPN